VVVTDGQLPAFLVGKVRAISAGVLRAEIQRCTGGWMLTEFPDWKASDEAGSQSGANMKPGRMGLEGFPRVIVVNVQVPGFLVGKLESAGESAAISDGVLRAEFQPWPSGSGWMGREYPDWSAGEAEDDEPGPTERMTAKCQSEAGWWWEFHYAPHRVQVYYYEKD
jgi:hypothetical protein